MPCRCYITLTQSHSLTVLRRSSAMHFDHSLHPPVASRQEQLKTFMPWCAVIDTKGSQTLTISYNSFFKNNCICNLPPPVLIYGYYATSITCPRNTNTSWNYYCQIVTTCSRPVRGDLRVNHNCFNCYCM